jgi:hypothetical protein
VAIQARAVHVVELAWQPSTTTTVTGYNVYRGPDGSTWTKINPNLVASTLFDDSTVANTSTYSYAVTAMDVLGNESKKTAAVKAAVLSLTGSANCSFTQTRVRPANAVRWRRGCNSPPLVF